MRIGENNTGTGATYQNNPNPPIKQQPLWTQFNVAIAPQIAQGSGATYLVERVCGQFSVLYYWQQGGGLLVFVYSGAPTWKTLENNPLAGLQSSWVYHGAIPAIAQTQQAINTLPLPPGVTCSMGRTASLNSNPLLQASLINTNAGSINASGGVGATYRNNPIYTAPGLWTPISRPQLKLTTNKPLVVRKCFAPSTSQYNPNGLFGLMYWLTTAGQLFVENTSAIVGFPVTGPTAFLYNGPTPNLATANVYDLPLPPGLPAGSNCGRPAPVANGIGTPYWTVQPYGRRPQPRLIDTPFWTGNDFTYGDNATAGVYGVGAVLSNFVRRPAPSPYPTSTSSTKYVGFFTSDGTWHGITGAYVNTPDFAAAIAMLRSRLPWKQFITGGLVGTTDSAIVGGVYLIRNGANVSQYIQWINTNAGVAASTGVGVFTLPPHESPSTPSSTMNDDVNTGYVTTTTQSKRDDFGNLCVGPNCVGTGNSPIVFSNFVKRGMR
jgi:hypothetical protein